MLSHEPLWVESVESKGYQASDRPTCRSSAQPGEGDPILASVWRMVRLQAHPLSAADVKLVSKGTRELRWLVEARWARRGGYLIPFHRTSKTRNS